MSKPDPVRRASFDADPELYARARPGYPDVVFDLIVEYAGVGPGSRALEIGCGPGQATLPMLRRGLKITAVEIGENMAHYAAQRLAGEQVQIVCAPFEEYSLPCEPFDLVYSASAFHWITPEVRWTKCAQALRPGGALALFWNRQVRCDSDEGFAEAVQAVYQQYAPRLASEWHGLPDPSSLDMTWQEEMEASELFGDVELRMVPWTVTFTADEFVDLLATYSEHAILPPDQKQSLLAGVHALVEDRFGGRVRRAWNTVVYLGRKHIR